MAITPKYLNLWRMDRCGCIWAYADRKPAPRLSKTAHFDFYMKNFYMKM